MRGEAIRFAVVGAVNTGVYYVLYLLLSLAIPYLAAHVSAFLLAMVGSFFLNCWYTFRIRPTWRKFVAFPAGTLVNLAVSTTALWAFVRFGGLGHRPAAAIAILLPVPLTFLVSRRILTGRALPAAGGVPAGVAQDAPRRAGTLSR